jgi:hypothetical protein
MHARGHSVTATAESRAASAQGRAATAKVSPAAATAAAAAMAATAAAMAATATAMAATAAATDAVLRISQRRNGRDRHRDQQRTERLHEKSGRHLRSRFDHSSSPHLMRAQFEGREAIH